MNFLIPRVYPLITGNVHALDIPKQVNESRSFKLRRRLLTPSQFGADLCQPGF